MVKERCNTCMNSGRIMRLEFHHEPPAHQQWKAGTEVEVKLWLGKGIIRWGWRDPAVGWMWAIESVSGDLHAVNHERVRLPKPKPRYEVVTRRVFESEEAAKQFASIERAFENTGANKVALSSTIEVQEVEP